MSLLIAGSRYASPEMLAAVTEEIEGMDAAHRVVVVGDNPKGIDAEVVRLCYQNDIHIMVFGIDPESRNKAVKPDDYRRLPEPLLTGTRKQQLYARDRWMCSLADEGIFIWNGESQGTLAGHAYMRSIGKPAHLKTF